MPELPEVETVRRGLEKLILGKTIQSVEVKYPKMIQTDLDAFRQDLPGQEIRAMGRRGKYLLFYLTVFCRAAENMMNYYNQCLFIKLCGKKKNPLKVGNYRAI